jgi:alginate O-acetyltransferase complex protein AlgI
MNPMMFANPAFLFLFAPVVLTGYLLIPRSWRNGFLLAASLLFYAWGEGWRVEILIASLAINYGFGLAIDRTRARKLALFSGVVFNLLFLGLFKYTSFAIGNLDWVLARFGLPSLTDPALPLPVGISFYTFMGISYLVDTYRRDIHAEPSPTVFGLYITLFPHLIAGPIVRYSDIAAQLHARSTRASEIVQGIRRFIIGLGKKLLIGNTLAATADTIFQLKPGELSTLVAWIGILCYALEIYYDFSGYSDMAIGLARMFGFRFPENFNYPYTSQSITEFWRRWHMSLSTWLRDYLFFPLGVRGGRWVLCRNLLIVFLLCGLWHGAAWHFVAWGLFYGAFLVLERMGLLSILRTWPAPPRHVYALLVVVTGWVLFRADTLHYAGSYLAAMSGFAPSPGSAYDLWRFLPADVVLALVAGVIGSMPVAGLLGRFRAKPGLGTLWAGAEFAVLALVFLFAAALSAAGTYRPFIYFRF